MVVGGLCRGPDLLLGGVLAHDLVHLALPHRAVHTGLLVLKLLPVEVMLQGGDSLLRPGIAVGKGVDDGFEMGLGQPGDVVALSAQDAGQGGAEVKGRSSLLRLDTRASVC